MCHWDEYDAPKACPCGCGYEWVDNPPYCNWPRSSPPDPNSPEGKMIANLQRLFSYDAEQKSILERLPETAYRRTKIRRS